MGRIVKKAEGWLDSAIPCSTPFVGVWSCRAGIMTTLDDLRRKAEAVALGEAAFLSEPEDIDLKSFVEEDPQG